jgi:hypothetical protein
MPVFDIFVEFVGIDIDFFGALPGKNYDELISSVTEWIMLHLIKTQAQSAGKIFQDLIAAEVAVLIIVMLKLIHVDKQE